MGHKQAKLERGRQAAGQAMLARRQKLVDELTQLAKWQVQAQQRMAFLQGAVAALNDEMRAMGIPLPK